MGNGLTNHDFANPGWRQKDDAAMLGKAEEQVNAEPGIAIESGENPATPPEPASKE
jgi:hypothetical protein